MGAGDVAQVTALDAAAFTLPWPRQAFEAQLKANNRRCPTVRVAMPAAAAQKSAPPDWL